MTRALSLLLMLCGLFLGQKGFAFQHPHGKELPDFDKRKEAAGALMSGHPHAPAAAKAPANLPFSVELDEVTGSPRFISGKNKFLSGKGGKGGTISDKALGRFPENDPHRITKAFVEEHRALFRHGAEAIQAAKVRRDQTRKHNGLKTTVWQQELDGLPVFDAYLVSHITKEGELVSISSRFVADPVNAATRGVQNKAQAISKPPVPVQQAISLAAATLGDQVDAESISPNGKHHGPEYLHQYGSKQVQGDIYAGLVWTPISPDMMRLCWEITLTGGEHRETFLFLVDAETREILLRLGLTRHLTSASYTVFTGESPTPMCPGHPVPSNAQPAPATRQVVTLSALSTNASPLGWIPDGGTTTTGNNVYAQLDRDSDNISDGRPESASREFNFPLDLSQDPQSYGDASVVQLFYWCNWAHDKLYELGFTEAAGNFQLDNFGRGGKGGDAVQADAQERLTQGIRNGASFTTLADGIPGRMQVMAYNGTNPHRDGAFDAHIVLHEYVHGLTDRMVAGGMGMVAQATQSEGLAEGWSDFFALALLSSPTNDVHGTYPFAPYVGYRPSDGFEQNYYFGTRRYPYTTDLTKNPLTFKDIDPSQDESYPSIPRSTYPIISPLADAVHNQGEVWCSTLWEARANLITKHGFEVGNTMILQLVVDGLVLCPPNPNFLQARDAILLADQINHGGANQAELWAAFAKRGMGFFATSPKSSTTQGVVESFAMPDDLSILPNAGLLSTGAKGGPFVPNTRTYIFSNIGPDTVTWSVSGVAAWLSLSSTNGTIAPGGSQTVTAAIYQPVAGTLPAGNYTNILSFTNSASGVVQRRSFILRIGQRDYFTEFFDLNDFDLGFQSFTFTPDGSGNFYSACRTSITNLPSDPSGGSVLNLTDDSSTQIALSGAVGIYTNTDKKVYVGSNGYITWGAGDTSRLNQETLHFGLPRVSALFTDLVPQTNSVSWRQFTNRVAITYSNVLEWGTYKTNTFQVELFFDGRIRISYLAMGTRNGLVGLSPGGGVPSSYMESDFSHYIECAPAISVSVPEAVFENAGTLTAAGELHIGSPLAADLTVSLFVSDNTQLSVPSQVIIPAGATSATFDIEIINDIEFDGTRPVAITAAGNGFQNGSDTIYVHDDEVVALTVTLPGSASEGSGTFSGTVTMQDFHATDDVTIALSSDAPHRITVPPTVIIPGGQSSATFPVTAIDNTSIDGDELVTIQAEVVGWETGVGTTIVTDNEDRDLRFRLPQQAIEGNGTLNNAGSVHLSGTLGYDLTVELESFSPQDVGIPPFVIIPAGEMFASFDLNILDDELLDGPSTVQFQAATESFTSAIRTMVIDDNETPAAPSNPRPAHLSSNSPTLLTLSWDPPLSEGHELLTNGGFELGSLEGVSLVTNSNSHVDLFTETADFSALGFSSTNFSGFFSLALRQDGTGMIELTRTVSLPEAQTISIGWADRILSLGSSFSSSNQFRVELRDTNDVILSRLFTTEESMPSENPWTARRFDISAFRGRSIEIVFVLQSATQGLSVLLDEMSVRSSNPPLTTYDVYFGTNPTPEELLGSTTNTFWDLPELTPFNTYYWKVVARRLGEAVGPVWQFTTVPTISVTDVMLAEGHSGSTSALFSLQLSVPSAEPITVAYATANDTALTGSDYVATNGTVEFAPGETNKTIEVSIIGDDIFEGHEQFALNLSVTGAAALASAQVTCTILEDDSVLFPILNKTVTEGSLLTFAVETGVFGQGVTELITDFESFSGTANGTVMFRQPANNTYLENSPRISLVTNVFPGGHSGSNVIAVSCSFKNTSNPWLQLSTAPDGLVATPEIPNPTVHLQRTVQFDVYTDRTIRLGLGIRETGTTNAVGADGGTSGTVEFVGVTNKVIGPNTPMPVRTISGGTWQRVSFNLPAEPITSLNGDGVLQSASSKGALAHLAIVPNAGTGLYNMYFDNFAVVYTNQLIFSLSNAPAGASIDSETGVFTWTPIENQGPGVYEIFVHATDGSGINETRSFFVTVNEANTAPSLTVNATTTVVEQTTLSFTANASDADLPANTLTFSLDHGPTGASIDPVTGVFTWTPTEAQGPNSYVVQIRVTDNGVPALSQPASFSITVLETNSAPTLMPIADQSVDPNGSISFQTVASDLDVPTNSLTFSLIGTPPSGASINPQTGLFTWPNVSAPAGSTNAITVQVQDNGSPVLYSTQTFRVIVSAPSIIQSIHVTGGQITLSWNALSGETYSVQYSTDLVNWTELQQVTASGATASLVQEAGEVQRFYRILLAP